MILIKMLVSREDIESNEPRAAQSSPEWFITRERRTREQLSKNGAQGSPERTRVTYYT